MKKVKAGAKILFGRADAALTVGADEGPTVWDFWRACVGQYGSGLSMVFCGGFLEFSWIFLNFPEFFDFYLRGNYCKHFAILPLRP